MASPSAGKRRDGPAAQRPVSTREAVRQRGPSRRQLSRHQREQRLRRGLLVGGAALLAVIVAVLGFGYWRENVGRAQDTVAVAFGERITASDLLGQVRPRLAALDRRIALFRANGLEQQIAQLQFQRNRLPESVLGEMIEDRLVRREADRRGITVSPEEVDARLRQQVADADARTQPQPTPTIQPTPVPDATPAATPAGTPTPRPTPTVVPTLAEDRYAPAQQDFFTQTGFSEAEVRRAIESELYEEKLRRAIGDELQAVQEQVRARHLVFKTEEEAKAALEQLQAGAAWDQLAAQSQDRATKDQGGDLGWLPRLGRDPAFDEALFSLPPGQPSVVQTASGWEIIEVLERDPARPVAEPLLDELRRRHYGDWLAAAQGSPEIDRQLSPDESAWVLQRASRRA